ncbi:MAG TPA: acyl-CoA dehydrogenase family protein [Chloroflexota bacterium]|nr:acyl-CoA dehydrogenase family protein [Chloroflexota bacterium]
MSLDVALEAGGAAWSAVDLFNPSPEHALLRETIRQLVRDEVEPQALEHDRAERFNLALFRQFGALDLLGLTVSAEDGGAGMDAVAAAIVHEEVSTSDPGFCLAYLAHAILFVNNLARNGSAEQRERYLPDAISGATVCGMGMTEPEGGTDVLGMRTTAVRENGFYVLNGRKMWITNGAIDDRTLGDVFLIYARTEDGRISTFIVEKGFPGFSLGQKITGKLGCRASSMGELVFDDCLVPAGNLIGAEGQSVLHMMRNLELERVTLAAMSLGIGLRCLREMVRWADQRVAFGRPIRDFGQIQRHIADSYAQWRAARSYVYDVARRMHLDQAGNRVDSDGVKLVAGTTAKEIADRAIQVLGAYGYVAEGVVERLWRDAKMVEIGGGTVEAHQKNISRDLSRAADLLLR